MTFRLSKNFYGVGIGPLSKILAVKFCETRETRETPLYNYTLQQVRRPVVPGGAGGAMAPPIFGRSINPISTKGADYAHQISDLPTALLRTKI